MCHSNLWPFKLLMVCTGRWLLTQVDVSANIYSRYQILLVQCRARDNKKLCQRGCAVAQRSLLAAWGSQRKLLPKERAGQSRAVPDAPLLQAWGNTPVFTKGSLLFHRTLSAMLSIAPLQKAQLQELAEMS